MSWTEAQADILVRHVLRKWGAAWPLLGEHLRAAIVDRKWAETICSLKLDDDKLSLAAIQDLRAKMHWFARVP